MKLKAVKYDGGVIFVDEEADIKLGDFKYHHLPGIFESTDESDFKQRLKNVVKVVAQSEDMKIPRIPHVKIEIRRYVTKDNEREFDVYVKFLNGVHSNVEFMIENKHDVIDCNQEIVAYRIKDLSNIRQAQQILKDYLIEHEVWNPKRDMTKEGRSFANGSAFYDVFVKNGLLGDWYRPVYYSEVNAPKERTVQAAAEEYAEEKSYLIEQAFLDGAMSDFARDYWYRHYRHTQCTCGGYPECICRHLINEEE